MNDLMLNATAAAAAATVEIKAEQESVAATLAMHRWLATGTR